MFDVGFQQYLFFRICGRPEWRWNTWSLNRANQYRQKNGDKLERSTCVFIAQFAAPWFGRLINHELV